MTAMLNAYAKIGETMPGDVSASNDTLQAHVEAHGETLNEEIGGLVKALWASSSIQDIFARRSEFQLNDSAEYYFTNIDRLMAPSYIPDEQDVLRSRVRTTGIVQSDFSIRKVNFSMCVHSPHHVPCTLS